MISHFISFLSSARVRNESRRVETCAGWGKGGCQQSVEILEPGYGRIADPEGGGFPRDGMVVEWPSETRMWPCATGFDKNFIKIFRDFLATWQTS